MSTYSEARATLRAKRKDAKLTLGALGARCGKSASLICEWEGGTRTPTAPDALALEGVLGEPKLEAWGYDRATLRRPEKTDEVQSLPATGTDAG